MVSIRSLIGTIGLAGLLYLPLNSQEIPKNFKPVGIVESQEEDKNNNGVQDSEEKVIDYNNAVYKYFRVYHKETRKQTYFIADKNYDIIKDPELYYHLFSVITINESAKKAKKENLERSLNEWASDYKRINRWILGTDFTKKAIEELSELEGLLINKNFFGGTKIPEAIDYVLVEGSDLMAKKRVNDEFKGIIMELAEGLATENPKDIAKYVLNNMQNITAAKITEAGRRLLIARKKLEDYDPNKDFWSLPQAERFVNDLVEGLEGITYAKAYLASLGDGNSLEIGAKLIAENFASGLTGVSIDKIAANLNRNEHLQRIKNTIEGSRTSLAKSLGKFYTALDPKQDLTLRSLLAEEGIISQEKIEPKDLVKDKKPEEDDLEKKIASYESEVPATQEWTLIGTVKKGEKISVVASGKWNRSPLTELDANGLSTLSSNPPGEGLRESALIGKFGEEGIPFFVGKGYMGIVPINGDFYLGHNDYSLEDNSGALGVKIIRYGSTLEDKLKNDEIKTPKEEVEIEWSKEMGTSGRSFARVIVKGKEGSLWVAGSTTESLGERNFGDYDSFIMKFDKKEKDFVIKQIGTKDYDGLVALVLDSQSNCYFIINKNPGPLGKYFFTKFNPELKEVFKKELKGTPAIDYSALAVDNLNNVYVAGWNGGGNVIKKYEPGGEQIWSKEFNKDWFNKFESLAIDKEYNLYVSSNTTYKDGKNFIVKYAPDGNELWTREFDRTEKVIYDLKISQENNVYITGMTSSDLNGINKGKEDLFLSKMDSKGRTVWDRQMGTEEADIGDKIAIDNKENIYLIGRIKKSGGVILKYNQRGDEIWSKNFKYESKPPMYPSLSDILVDEESNIYLVGTKEYNGSKKIFITKFRQK